MSESELEKTEQATPKKRQEARKKGQVAKSQDLIAVAGLFAAVAVLVATSRSQAEYAFEYFQNALSAPYELQTTAQEVASSLSKIVFLILGKLSALFAVVVLSSVAVNVLQSGFLFLPQKIAPDFKRVDPFQNASKLFSLSNLWQTLFGFIKISAFVVLVALAIRRDAETLINLVNGTTLQIVLFLYRFLARLAFQFCAVFLIFAVVDYILKRIKHERELRMTVQELREEMKEESGDPQARGRRRDARRILLDPIGGVSRALPPPRVSSFQKPKKKQENKRNCSDRV